MRKTIALLLTAGMVLSLSACSGSLPGAGNPAGGQNGAPAQGGDGSGGTQGMDGNGGGSPQSAEGSGGAAQGGTADGSGAEGGGLHLLSQLDHSGCHTEDGYYYLVSEPEKLSDGSYGSHMMYMDFATRQEIYLCSNAGCRHDTGDCQSVFLHDDFPSYTSLLFIHGDGLYILSKHGDYDGAVSYGSGEGVTLGAVNFGGDSPAVLYRANLDGTGRERIHTFDASVTLEDFVFGDGNGIYVVTKRLASDRDGMAAYVNSSERSLVYLDLVTKEESRVCSMDFEGDIVWQFAGCYGRTVVMRGTDYGRSVSRGEMDDTDAYRDLYLNSEEVFATFDLDNPQPAEKYRFRNTGENTVIVDGNMLYVSLSKDGTVRGIDLFTGTERTICTQDGGFFFLWDIIGDKLCCKNKEVDAGFYYVDVETGKIIYSALVNKTLGWSLQFRAVLESDVLVIYDYEATPYGDGSYEITLYQYGLISKSDLFAGNDTYRPIQMVEKGW